MIWFYSVFPWLLLAFLTPDTLVVGKLFQFGGLAILIAFWRMEVAPQVKFLKEQLSDHYERKSWWKPLGIAAGATLGVILVLIIGFAVADSSDDAEITLVKHGHLSAYPNVPIGKAVSSFMANPKWESGTANDGTLFVNVRGRIKYESKEVEALVQYEINRKAGTFELRTVEFNGVPQNRLVQLALMSKMFESYGR